MPLKRMSKKFWIFCKQIHINRFFFQVCIDRDQNGSVVEKVSKVVESSASAAVEFHLRHQHHFHRLMDLFKHFGNVYFHVVCHILHLPVLWNKYLIMLYYENKSFPQISKRSSAIALTCLEKMPTRKYVRSRRRIIWHKLGGRIT